MITQNNSLMSCTLLSRPYLLFLLPCDRNGMKKLRLQCSKKQDFTENLKSKQDLILLATKSFKVPNAFLVRSALAILALGFIDAGYSGDWSRIGVISKGNEDFLKLAAFVVVPLCLYLIFSFSEQEHEDIN